LKKDLPEDIEMTFESDADGDKKQPKKPEADDGPRTISKGPGAGQQGAPVQGAGFERSSVQEELARSRGGKPGSIDPFEDPGVRKQTVVMDRDTVNKIVEQTKAQNEQPAPAEPEPVARDRKNISLKKEPKASEARPVQGWGDSNPPAKKSRKGLIAFFIILAVCLFATDKIVQMLKGGGEQVAQTSDQPVTPAETGTTEAPAVPQGSTTFPVLPAGVYSGSITGFLPDKPVPLVFMSLPEEKKISVIIGIEGWSPSVASTESFLENGENFGSNTLRIASNGFVLDFVGQPSQDAVIGTFKNSITGEQGEWQVTIQP
jgi:hypothetical protein